MLKGDSIFQNDWPEAGGDCYYCYESFQLLNLSLVVAYTHLGLELNLGEAL